MNAELPQPLVAGDVDCTEIDSFLLNAERLMASELVALSSHEIIGAALLLWCRAWKQRPAASLPSDDKVIAAFARLPLARFRKLRGEVMRGFVLCADGRFYHRTLAVVATDAYARRRAFEEKREKDAKRLKNWRDTRHAETHVDTGDETRFKTRGETEDETRFVAEVSEVKGSECNSHIGVNASNTAPARGSPLGHKNGHEIKGETAWRRDPDAANRYGSKLGIAALPGESLTEFVRRIDVAIETAARRA